MIEVRRRRTDSDCVLDIIYKILALLKVLGILQTVFLACEGIARPTAVFSDTQFFLQGFEFCSLSLLLSLLTSGLTLNVLS